ncbi:unnamed protein product [Miscanthus lutarioriparius]|uniref:Chromatin assembly factor 1 subunit A dimerization domain-containing protein n=1 Tax=Miscanthus lutarioriparius TaxID=422564 RepID=A0A811QLM5_9POAL|nr:unnamed protein product [Miscanthus lutarioriparius]
MAATIQVRRMNKISLKVTLICYRLVSAVIGPRCPLKMDPDLDYEVDSDDEWEEVLADILASFFLLFWRILVRVFSDCEKDNDEFMEDSKITDEEDEDSFVVPDGYLSDNEEL